VRAKELFENGGASAHSQPKIGFFVARKPKERTGITISSHQRNGRPSAAFSRVVLVESPSRTYSITEKSFDF
jgi:hypothetical protein